METSRTKTAPVSPQMVTPSQLKTLFARYEEHHPAITQQALYLYLLMRPAYKIPVGAESRVPTYEELGWVLQRCQKGLTSRARMQMFLGRRSEKMAKAILEEYAAELNAWTTHEDLVGPVHGKFMAYQWAGRVPKEFNYHLVITTGANLAYDACAKLFPCAPRTTDFDSELIRNDRTVQDPNGDHCYHIRVRDSQEADPVLANHSAKQLRRRKISGETLAERLWHEVAYYLETGEHLGVTLCSGSLFREGGIPNVCWAMGKLRVGSTTPDDARENLAARQVIRC